MNCVCNELFWFFAIGLFAPVFQRFPETVTNDQPRPIYFDGLSVTLNETLFPLPLPHPTKNKSLKSQEAPKTGLCRMEKKKHTNFLSSFWNLFGFHY